jgi:hypothetical protein
LIAGRRVEEEDLAGELITEAERHVEQAGTDGTLAMVACLVCDTHLSRLEAADHGHLRVPSPT